MLRIVWNRRGFHLSQVLEERRKFKAIFYRAEILLPLSEWRSIKADGDERTLIVHAENARPHTAKVSTQLLEEN
jgi:hypothetical protein